MKHLQCITRCNISVKSYPPYSLACFALLTWGLRFSFCGNAMEYAISDKFQMSTKMVAHLYLSSFIFRQCKMVAPGLSFLRKERVSPTVPVQIPEKWNAHLAEFASFVCPPSSVGRAVVLCFEAK